MVEPLKITAFLRTPVVSDQWLPLDGVLLYQAHREALGVQASTQPGGNAPSRGINVPLLIRNPRTPFWYYACSFAQPQPWWMAEGTDHWNKRFDSGFAALVDFEGRRGKVVIEQGRYKAYHMPLFYRATSKIEWYCVGAQADIEWLLSTATHLGKKSAQGWGRVVHWQVESWLEDWSVWHDDVLMRAVPASEIAGKGPFDLMYYGLRPSYYRKENQMLVAMPRSNERG